MSKTATLVPEGKLGHLYDHVQYNEILGQLGFEGVDPRFSDVVFHVTNEDNLEAIGEEGLRPSDKSKDMFGESDHFLMEGKPVDIPVDLEHVVYGQLEERHLGTRHEGGYSALRTRLWGGESIAVAVDPEDTYVGDARVREIMEESLQPGGGRDIGRVREYYWRNVLPLKVFRELYKPIGGHLVGWKLKDRADAERLGLRYIFDAPETYIPLDGGQDTVPVERLSHTASTLLDRTY